MSRTMATSRMFWLKAQVFACSEQLVWFPFASLVRRIFMVRKGWTAMDVPSGLRGPRPPSQRWPQAHEQKPAIRRWRNHQSQKKQSSRAPPGPSGTSSSTRSCKEQEARTCIGSDGHGGSCSASHQAGLGGVGRMDFSKHLELRDALEIGPNELVDISQLISKRCFGNARCVHPQ